MKNISLLHILLQGLLITTVLGRKVVMTEEPCIEKDNVVAGWVTDSEQPVDDYWVLKQKYYEGVSVRAIVYCTADRYDGSLNSIQLYLWKDNEEEKIKLRRFGRVRLDLENDGGTCKIWNLDEGDTMKYIRVEYDEDEQRIIKLYFMTVGGKRRIIGSGNGRNTYFDFDMFSPFIGFHGY